MPSMKLLIADDEPVLREIYQELFGIHGHRAITCASGEDAVPLLREERFDALLTDYQMTGGDGFWLARTARAQNPDLPIILITGEIPLSEKDERIADTIGFQAILEKPLDLPKLLDALRTPRR